MKEQTLKHLNTLLREYENGKSQLEIELLNDEVKENERLEMNSNLKEISSDLEEVKECIDYISKLPDFQYIDFSEVKSHRITLPDFIETFNSYLKDLGLTKKFNETISLKNFSQKINLENIGSYENNDNWNEFLHLVDFYYPGALLAYYPDIPFQNYATKISN